MGLDALESGGHVPPGVGERGGQGGGVGGGGEGGEGRGGAEANSLAPPASLDPGAAPPFLHALAWGPGGVGGVKSLQASPLIISLVEAGWRVVFALKVDGCVS